MIPLYTYIYTRIVTDGDIISGLPPFSNYAHVGTEVLIEGSDSSGLIIINPSYIESVFIRKAKTSMDAHVPGTYMTGLCHIKAVASTDIDISIVANKNPLPSFVMPGRVHDKDNNVSFLHGTDS